MSTLFVNFKFIASWNWNENWFKKIKKHYKRQNNDHIIMFKRLQKLKLFNVWIKVNEINKTEMKKNLKEQMKKECIDNDSHDNAILDKALICL